MTEQANPLPSGALKVLYVEDYPPSVALVCESVRRRAPNIHLEAVTTVAQAIEQLDRFERNVRDPALAEAVQALRYDAVLTDLDLPDGSGFDILAHVRDRQLKLAVVIMTASTEEDTALSALRAGANAYIAKRDDYLIQLPHTLYAAIADFHVGVSHVVSPRA